MAEFTQTMSGDSRYSIKLTVTEVVPSDYVTTNKTNVNYTLTATKSGGSGYWNNNANNPVKVTINGTDVVNTNVAYDFRNATPKTITLASGTVTGIEHNADGSKTIAVSGYFKDNGNSLGQATASGNLTLTTIPRASQPSVQDVYGDLGDTFTINTNRASNSFTHTINIKVGSTTVETFTNVGASKSWTPTIATYAPYRPDGQFLIATVECITFNGGTNLGTKSTSVQLFIPQITSGANKTTPDCSISIQEDNATMKTLNWGVYVKGKSQLKVTITGTPKFSTTMDTYSSNANGSAYSGSFSGSGQQSKSYTTNTLTGDGSVTATVKDKRNYSSSQASQSYTTQSYSNPQITTSQVYRCDSSGNQDDSGTYIKYIYSGSISSVSNKNSKTFTLRYKPKNGSWTTVSDSSWNSSYTLSDKTAVLSGFSTSTEYEFEFSATDSFTTTTITKEIGTEPDLMNFNASGKSMAIGGVSQRGANDKYLDVYTDAEFHKNLSANTLQIQHMVSNTENTSSWIYKKLCNIKLTSHQQGRFLFFKIFVASGNNGNDHQQAYINLTLQSGWTGSVSGRFGGSWELFACNSPLTPSQFKIICIAKSGNTDYDLWLGTNQTYCRANYTYSVDSGVTITHASDSTTTEPTGTTCEISGGYVSKSRTADSAGTATTATSATNSNYGKTLEAKDGRISNANITHYYDNDKAHCKLLLATSSMTSNKPTQGDGYILCFNWDNNGQYIGQLFVPNNKDTNLQFRGCTSGTWGSWRTMPFKDEIEKYSTSEQAIGTWINGETLYRKVFTFSFTNSNDVTITHNISNLKQVIKCEGGFKEGNGTSRFIPQFYPANMSSAYSIDVYTVSSTQIVINGNTWVKNNYSSLNSGFIILTYIKSS